MSSHGGRPGAAGVAPGHPGTRPPGHPATRPPGHPTGAQSRVRRSNGRLTQDGQQHVVEEEGEVHQGEGGQAALGSVGAHAAAARLRLRRPPRAGRRAPRPRLRPSPLPRVRVVRAALLARLSDSLGANGTTRKLRSVRRYCMREPRVCGRAITEAIRIQSARGGASAHRGRRRCTSGRPRLRSGPARPRGRCEHAFSS